MSHELTTGAGDAGPVGTPVDDSWAEPLGVLPLAREHRVAVDFLRRMDQLDRVIRAAEDPDGLMSAALDLLLDVFDADRALLLPPGDPQAGPRPSAIQRTRPGCSGAPEPGTAAPVNGDVAQALRLLLAADGPVTFGPGNAHPLPESLARRFAIASCLSMAIRPKGGPAWQLGVLACRQRVWTAQELRLFQEMGRRIADGLGTLLTLQDLRHSEERYSRIVNTANEGIWVLGADDRTTFVNPQLCRMLGYRPEEMLGRGLEDFTFPEDLAHVAARAQDRHQGGGSLRYERRLRRRDGQVLWANVCVTPELVDGRYRGAFAMVSDITQQKLAEQRLQQLNEELERRVRERTQELQAAYQQRDQAFRELQLAHSRVLQQEKLASIGQLAAGIAHEINTPSQFVGDNLVFLRDCFPQLLDAVARAGPGCTPDLQFLSEEIPRALAESVSGMQRIATIVAAMKEFAHRSGERPAALDLRRLVSNAVEISRHEWKLVARVEVALAEGLPTVTGRRDELGQVLINLLVNAAHAIAAADRGGTGGLIRISSCGSGDHVEIRVQDNGCGMTPEVARRIFEPFFTTKPVGQGSGQGLAIAYDIIVTNHHGELLVDSTPGVGTTFVIRLPVGGGGG